MRAIDWSIHTPPLTDAETMDLIRLWRTEWKQGDFDWVSSLSGDYAESLRLSVVTGRKDGRLAVTATAVTREGGGEICLVSSVMTSGDYRGLGLGAEATERAVAEARRQGARVAYLGTNAWPRNVYHKIGFAQLGGIVMRRPLAEGPPPEDEIFAPSQPTKIREAVWGDAPAFVALVLQPLQTFLLSYRHSLVSAKYAPPRRCVSNYAPLYSDCLASGGKLFLLSDQSEARVFGFAALRPLLGGLSGTAWIEAVTHTAYQQELPKLLNHACQEARQISVRDVLFCCHEHDTDTRQALLQNGFEPSAVLESSFGSGGSLGLFQKTLAAR